MPNTYEAIATTTLGSAVADVTFSSISGAYTDLVLVINGSIDSGTARDASIGLQFNSDTTTNYSETFIQGNGSSASSSRETSINSAVCGSITEAQSVSIIQIMNYSNATTYKTILGRGNATNTRVRAYVSLWRATPAAITTIKVLHNDSGYNFRIGSTFSLYGIKAA